MKWKTPPTAGRQRTSQDEVDANVAQLRANPGRWALIDTDVPANRRDPYKKAGCDTRTTATGREYQNGRVDLYARWPTPGPLDGTTGPATATALGGAPTAVTKDDDTEARLQREVEALRAQLIHRPARANVLGGDRA